MAKHGPPALMIGIGPGPKGMDSEMDSHADHDEEHQLVSELFPDADPSEVEKKCEALHALFDLIAEKRDGADEGTDHEDEDEAPPGEGDARDKGAEEY